MKLKDITKTALYLILMIGLILMFGSLGAIGFLAFLLFMTLLRAWQNRESIITTMKYAESTIFGKPLDKTYWKKGEMKNTKVKIVWRKNDKRTNNKTVKRERPKKTEGSSKARG